MPVLRRVRWRVSSRCGLVSRVLDVGKDEAVKWQSPATVSDEWWQGIVAPFERCCALTGCVSGRLPRSDIGYPDDVGKDTGCRYACARAVSLDAHRVFLVAFGSDEDDVVAAFEIEER